MGKLVQVATGTASASANLTLTGIDTDDVYLLTLMNIVPATANADVYLRVTESGSASSDSDYDQAYKVLRADTTFQNEGAQNNDHWQISGSLQTDTGKSCNGYIYIYNANNSSEYTFISAHSIFFHTTILGEVQSGAYTQTTAVDGIQVVFDTGNIASGTATLYRVTS
jgi:hypothetical protein